MWEQATERRSLRLDCAWIGRGSFSNELVRMEKKNPPDVQLALCKTSQDKQSHSCSVPTETGKVYGDLIVPNRPYLLCFSVFGVILKARVSRKDLKIFCWGISLFFFTVDSRKGARVNKINDGRGLYYPWCFSYCHGFHLLF